MVFVASETVKDAFNNFKIDLRKMLRFHTNRGGEIFKHMDRWLSENSIWHSTSAGYDPQANGVSEAFVGVIAKDWRSLSRQAGAPTAVWAITFINEVKNRTKRTIDGTKVEPLLLESRENGETVEILPEQDRAEFWPPWGCQAIAITDGSRRRTLASRDHGCLS